MTYDEMIAVIQAHKEGKKLQYRNVLETSEWSDVGELLTFNFSKYEYRIKPEPHYRPFKSAEEVMAAIKEHGIFVGFKVGDEPFTPLVAVANTYVKPYREMIYDFKEALAAFTFADGTPFGVMED